MLVPGQRPGEGSGKVSGEWGDTSSQDQFAFVPFLDMTNHDTEPNADFSCERGAHYILRALRTLEPGEEVLISYRKEMCNRIYQALYGFVPQGGNYNDDIEIPEDVLMGRDAVANACPAAAGQPEGAEKGGVEFLRPLENPNIKRLTAPLLEQALGLDDEENAQKILSSDARLNAVLMSLPLTPVMPPDGVDGDREVLTAQHLLAYVALARREMASTSLQEDQELMHSMLHQPLEFDSSPPVNAQLLSAINYRMERKRLLEKAIAILRGYLAALGVPT